MANAKESNIIISDSKPPFWKESWWSLKFRHSYEKLSAVQSGLNVARKSMILMGIWIQKLLSFQGRQVFHTNNPNQILLQLYLQPIFSFIFLVRYFFSLLFFSKPPSKNDSSPQGAIQIICRKSFVLMLRSWKGGWLCIITYENTPRWQQNIQQIGNLLLRCRKTTDNNQPIR